MNNKTLVAILFLWSSVAPADEPTWETRVISAMDPLPVGYCVAIRLDLNRNGTHEMPRDRQGMLMNMTSFDMSVEGVGAAGKPNGPGYYDICGCQGGAPGGTVTVTATYPAASLPEAKRWPNVSFQRSVTVTLAAPKTSVNPPACANLVTTPGATPVPPRAVASANSRVPAPAAAPATQPGAAGGSVRGAEAVGGVSFTPGEPSVAITMRNPNPEVSLEPAGNVILRFAPVPEAAYYVIFGPGFTPGGEHVDQIDPRYLNDGSNRDLRRMGSVLPPGTHEWAVASYYAGNLSTPAANFSRVSLTVPAPAAPATPDPMTSSAAPATPPTSAPPASSPPPASTPPPAAAPATNRYLVSITGIRAYQASMDDMLSRDGVGDEIYASAYVRNYDRRTNQLASVDIRTSMPHGDVTHFGQQRLQAGTRSGTGGIRDGDMIPDGALIATRTVPIQATTFPMRIFEGAMADGVDTLLISPSIWEQDGTNAYFVQWQQNQAFLNNSLFAKQGVHDEIANKTFKALKFGMSANDANTGGTSVAHTIVDTMVMMGGGGIPIVGLLSQSGDRPLGLQENGRDQTALPNHVIVLTREIIEAALARPALGPIVSPVLNAPAGGLIGTPAIARVPVIAPKPGVIVLQFEDRNISGTLAFPERPAIYQMYIQVERLP